MLSFLYPHRYTPGRRLFDRSMLWCLTSLLILSTVSGCLTITPSEVTDPVPAPTLHTATSTPVVTIPQAPTQTAQPQSTYTVRDETVTLWHSFKPETIEAKSLGESLMRFEKTYPHINVLPRYRGTDTQLLSLLYSASENQSLPDIIIASSTSITDLTGHDMLVPLDSFPDRLSWSQNPLLANNICYGCGPGVYSQPYMIEGVGLWYNPDILTALGVADIPTDWSAFADACEYIQAVSGPPSALFLLEGPTPLALVLSSGETLVSAPPFLQLSGDTADILQMIQDLSWSESIQVIQDREQARELLTEGQYPFCVGTTELFSQEESLERNLSIAPLPQLSPDRSQSLIFGQYIAITNDATESREPAWTLLQFLQSPEESAQTALTTGHIPTSPLALPRIEQEAEQSLVSQKSRTIYNGTTIVSDNILGLEAIKIALSQIIIDTSQGYYVPKKALDLARENISQLVSYYSPIH